jgi:uncharacterized protein
VQLLWGFCLLFFSGCSGMLYYPDHLNYLEKIQNGFGLKHTTFSPAPEIQLDLWEASKEPRDKKPCVLLIHGNGQNASAHIQNILWMVDLHVRVFSFDYRGYGSSTESPSPENTVADAIKAIDHVAGLCGGGPISLIGQSLGGAVTLRALAEYPGKLPVKAVVIESSFLSYRRISVDVLSRMWLTWPFQWLGWLVMSDKWAPKSALDRVPDLPILVFHGTADTVVPFRFGEELFEKLKVPNKKFIAVPTGRHTESFWVGGGRYRAETLRWLLGKPAAPEKPGK